MTRTLGRDERLLKSEREMHPTFCVFVEALSVFLHLLRRS